MKLYIQDEDVLLDYSDVNFEDVKDQARSDYYAFIRSCSCGWEPTLKPKVKRFAYGPSAALTPYGNLAQKRMLLGNCYVTAIYFNTIEVTCEVKKLLDKIEEQCHKLRDEEIAKENARKAAEEWKEKCKYGCGNCAYKRRWGDDKICTASGDILSEHTVPKSYVGMFYPCNLEAFPTENCPFNVNKEQEVV